MDRHPSGQSSNLHKVLETCKRVSLLTFTGLQGQAASVKNAVAHTGSASCFLVLSPQLQLKAVSP